MTPPEATINIDGKEATLLAFDITVSDNQFQASININEGAEATSKLVDAFFSQTPVTLTLTDDGMTMQIADATITAMYGIKSFMMTLAGKPTVISQ